MEYESKLLGLFGLKVKENGKVCNGSDCVVGTIQKGPLFGKISGMNTIGYTTSVNSGNLCWNNKRDENDVNGENYSFNLIFMSESYEVQMTLGVLPSLTIRNAKKEEILFNTFKGGFRLSHKRGKLSDELIISSKRNTYKYIGTSTDWDVPDKKFDKYEVFAKETSDGKVKMDVLEKLYADGEVIEEGLYFCPCSFEEMIRGNFLMFFEMVEERINQLFGLDGNLLELIIKKENKCKALGLFIEDEDKVKSFK